MAARDSPSFAAEVVAVSFYVNIPCARLNQSRELESVDLALALFVCSSRVQVLGCVEIFLGRCVCDCSCPALTCAVSSRTKFDAPAV